MKLTQQQIEDEVKEVKYFNWGTLTICAIELQNGFKVVGTSACADPAEYNADVGQALAYKQALDKVWALEGYILRTSLHYKEQIDSGELSPSFVQYAVDHFVKS